MKKNNSKKKHLYTKTPNKWIVNQVKKTLNKELKPVKLTMSAYQTSMKHGLLLLRDLHDQDFNKKKVIYKDLNILLLVPTIKTKNAPNEIALEEQLRHLVKQVRAIKYAHNLSDSLSQNDVDLILVIGGEETLPPEHEALLRTSPVKKAVWMSDKEGLSSVELQLAPLFDYVLTQNPANVSAYRSLRCKQCYDVPFAVNTDVFFPKQVDSGFLSDVLIVGDASSHGNLYSFVHSGVLSDKKVRVYGNGWESAQFLLPISSEEDLADYYNGAKIVINTSSSLHQMLEISACGAFQLIQRHPEINPHILTGELESFDTPEELSDKFAYYATNIDQRRLAASRALANNKYNHSYLQKGMQLLDIVFN
ncbi:glycosyltransferase [Paenibacillus sp. FJAT-26967]|uniref:glycosyltransferase family protein n=1 Tax=Paenibacillus sp. FJAT-26967 TaxID=1729690 RepID=UPI0008380E5A|nr:glycosyltransferase [Paenibacillus sp. FJAT-26967]